MAKMDNGWIKLHRKLLSWQWYSSPNHTRLFLHLLLTANHKETKYRKETILPGQLLTGRKELSANTGLSERAIRTVLKDLKTTNEVTIKSCNKYSIITIINWLQYQQNDQQSDQQVTSKHPKNDHIQEYKNERIINPPIIPLTKGEVDKRKIFVKPTIQEVQEYITLNNYRINAEEYMAHYESNGWRVGRNPMKDWRAACRTWEMKRRKDNPEQTKINIMEGL
jgi:hypothetical protein